MTWTTDPGTPANVIGVGLIGGSIGMALRQRGWHVTGSDASDATLAKALELGAIDEVGLEPTAAITFVATPVARDRGSTHACARGRVRGGHRRRQREGARRRRGRRPAVRRRSPHGRLGAGRHRRRRRRAVRGRGVGAHPDRRHRPTSAYTPVASVVSSFGAEVVALAPDRHDALVAVVSHVPHLTAATLMGLADERAEEHAALLRLAAGGFRDMTRIASGHPAIWPDICAENRDAIVDGLDAPDRRAGRDARASSTTATATALLDRARAGPATRGRTCRAASRGPPTWPRCASRCRTVPACSPR